MSKTDAKIKEVKELIRKHSYEKAMNEIKSLEHLFLQTFNFKGVKYYVVDAEAQSTVNEANNIVYRTYLICKPSLFGDPIKLCAGEVLEYYNRNQ